MSQPPKSTSTKPPAEAHKGLLDEDHLTVPKGIPRWQFLTLVALMIIMLIIFIVPSSSFMGMGGGGDRNPVVCSWERPGHGKVEWRESDVILTMRQISNVLRVDPLLGFQAGIELNRPEREDYVRVMVLNQLALDAGIRITDKDLAEHIRSSLQFTGASDQDFIQGVRNMGLDQRALEETMRRVLGGVRLVQMLGFAAGVPDPASIEEQWHNEHVEHAFDYAALEVDSLREEALAELPDDAGLEAWFNELDEASKDAFKTLERRSAEVVRFRDADTHPATALLEAFPEVVPEGGEPTPIEDLAQRYYDRVYFIRFQKTEMGAEPVPGARPTEWYTREEADRQLVAEAPIYFAMQRWLDDLKKRVAEGQGPNVDLLAEATKYGLDHRRIEDLTKEELTEAEDIGDGILAGQVFGLENEGDLSYGLFASQSGICFVRLTARSERTLPPFAEIRDKVVEKWLEPRTSELALERLKKIREGFESFTPEPPEGQEPDTARHYRATTDDFRAAVEGASLEVGHRGWLDQRGNPKDDPQADQPAHKFIASFGFSRGFYGLDDDEVAEPGLSADSKTAYLVRRAGKREVPLDRMSPRDYERMKIQSRSAAVYELGQKLDLDFLEQNVGLQMAAASEAQP
jgi:hypothetical protein